jgi:carboxylesterase type B
MVAAGTVSSLPASLTADNSAREFDPTPMINYSNDSFVAVIIQYRLGAFGFLNSPLMKADGGLNAGITDARAALQWVQDHIHLFGGDKDKVTIWGQSAGGGTVLHLIAGQAQGGRSNLWRSAVVSSPYLTPMGTCDSSFWAVSPSLFYG